MTQVKSLQASVYAVESLVYCVSNECMGTWNYLGWTPVSEIVVWSHWIRLATYGGWLKYQIACHDPDMVCRNNLECPEA